MNGELSQRLPYGGVPIYCSLPRIEAGISQTRSFAKSSIEESCYLMSSCLLEVQTQHVPPGQEPTRGEITQIPPDSPVIAHTHLRNTQAVKFSRTRAQK